MLPDRVSNPGHLTYESGALPIALRGPAPPAVAGDVFDGVLFYAVLFSHEMSWMSAIGPYPTIIQTVGSRGTVNLPRTIGRW